MSINWINELDNIEQMLLEGKTTAEIGAKYGVKKQRVYQVMQKHGLSTNVRKRKSFLRGKEPKHYWLNKMLVNKKIPHQERLEILEEIEIPDRCPVFDIELNYNGNSVGPGWKGRQECSPSIDRIDSSKGYVKDNIQIISWRANRIKNDSTPEELRKLADYMESL